MYAFVDESYITGSVHLIGALVLDTRQVDRLRMSLDEVIWKTNRSHPEVPLTAELHGQNLFQRSEEWKCLRQKTDVAFAVYRRALHHVAQAQGAWFVGGVRRIDRLEGRYVEPWPPHQIALQYTLEMVDEYADALDQQVTVIADQVQDQAHHEARMRQFHANGGTPGWKPRTLSRITFPIDWVDSRTHRCLQASDMLTFLYLRKRFVPNNERLAHQAAKMSDIVRPILRGEHVWTP
ncbi:MAG: DUF3800 domain-containing protein [Microbacterium sp.]|uniref:DUF3800 domain-containing protein n=1 Tax=Microbacterium sp. TaxID=51671 RepID=UPI00260FF3CF|nr:DUF3800 domain-containing protein [Microbacterium sp.]MCX6501975.1 DUF3800 domain-containing protein [Microbacterium sp.]